eukprot:6205367-Pleurochrysis_carterae.AAC.6
MDGMHDKRGEGGQQDEWNCSEAMRTALPQPGRPMSCETLEIRQLEQWWSGAKSTLDPLHYATISMINGRAAPCRTRSSGGRSSWRNANHSRLLSIRTAYPASTQVQNKCQACVCCH